MKAMPQPRYDRSVLVAVPHHTITVSEILDPSVAPGNERSQQAGRISALDFTKGALVLIMVLYHWLNYFVGVGRPFYRYLSFLPPSFICIAGFLISHVYLSKYVITDARLPRRLLIRGLKIVAIFVLLNLAIGLMMHGARGGRTFLEIMSPSSLFSIFVSGSMRAGRVVSFYVLVPIGYLLILSAGLLIVCRYYKHIFHVATAAALLGTLIVNLLGQRSPNLELVSIGLLGIIIGYVPIDRINSLLKRPYAVVLAYLLYVAVITLWNVPYPLQVVGVLLTLVLLYWLGTVSGQAGRMQRWIIMLGKYSLFGYIAQIAILQFLRRSLPGGLAEPALVLSLLVAVGLTVISVEAVDCARAKVPMVNRLYGAVFS
jgi:hypothetical protein